MTDNKVTGRLKRETSEMTVVWEIADFSSLAEDYLESESFQFLNTTWYLDIDPCAQSGRSEEFIALYINGEPFAPSKDVACKVFLKTLNGEKEEIFKEQIFDKDSGFVGGDTHLRRSDLLKRKSELLPSDVLTVIYTLKCELDVNDIEYREDDNRNDQVEAWSQTEAIDYLEYWKDYNRNDEVEASSQAEAIDCIEKLQQEFKELLLSGKNTDITLKVKGKEFKAHRNILAARSPAFSAMVEHEMKEKITGVVDIEDSDPDSFPDFLHYLYTARVERLTSEKAQNLYTTSDKYQVHELKTICLKYMLVNVSVENFCDFLTLSLRHHEKELTDAASQFFVQNSMAIVLTTKWQVFLGENPVASNELLIKLIREKVQ